MQYGVTIILAMDHTREFENLGQPANRGVKKTGPARREKVAKAVTDMVSICVGRFYL
jgi:hypothetical protein